MSKEIFLNITLLLLIYTYHSRTYYLYIKNFYVSVSYTIYEKPWPDVTSFLSFIPDWKWGNSWFLLTLFIFILRNKVTWLIKHLLQCAVLLTLRPKSILLKKDIAFFMQKRNYVVNGKTMISQTRDITHSVMCIYSNIVF